MQQKTDFNLMFYMTPKNITVGDIFGKSVILTVWEYETKISNKRVVLRINATADVKTTL